MSHLRDRRAFGNIGTRKFRGARFGDALSPRFEGLLDTYSGAAAAYSLRVLTRNWLAGDVVEVRRVNTPATASFTATQISNGELATWSLSGDAFVSKWYDQSGNGNNAVQATTTNQPKIVSAGSLITGGLDFDGSDDSFILNSSISLGTSFYQVLVSKPLAAISESNGSFVAESGGSGERTYLSTGSNALAIRDNSINTESTLNPNGTSQQILGFSSTSTDFTFILNQSTNVKSALAVSKSAKSIFGAGSFNLGGTANEIIIYASDQSSNRGGIEANINAAYSTY